MSQHPLVTKAFSKQQLELAEKDLDLIELRREIRAFASLAEEGGIKKHRVERMRVKAKEVARFKRSRDQSEMDDLINATMTEEAKSPKKVKAPRKYQTTRAKTAYNYYAAEKLQAYNVAKSTLPTTQRMVEIGAAWAVVRLDQEMRAEYDEKAAIDKQRHVSELAIEKGSVAGQSDDDAAVAAQSGNESADDSE